MNSRNGAIFGVVAISVLFNWLPVYAGGADFPITDVTVFKDGHALVLSQGTAQFTDGWCSTRDVPVPVLGTFWTFTSDSTSNVDMVRAGYVDVEEEQVCLTFDDIIRANTGKEVTVIEQPASGESETYTGKLLGILKKEPDEENKGADPELSSFLMLQNTRGVQLIKRENLRSLLISDDAPATKRSEKKRVREISFHVKQGENPANGEQAVGFVYLQKGIRWIPSYRIDLLENDQAKLVLQGTIINELADLENVDLRLVVGVPNFQMKDHLSPLALRETGLNLGSYFTEPGRREDRMRYSMSNAMMSQAIMPGVGGMGGDAISFDPAVSTPEMPDSGKRGDLFVYYRPDFSLKKGERAVVTLLEMTIPYTDLYTWDIPPVPPQEMWPQVREQQQQELAQALAQAKPMHRIHLTNEGQEPWTTGPALIFKEGTPLGQDLVTYTSVGNAVDVGVTVATDLNAKREEKEVGRETVRFNGFEYAKILLHGKLTVKNFGCESANVRVQRNIFGMATSAESDGKITHSDALESFADNRSAYPWFTWSWPHWAGVNSISMITWSNDIPASEEAVFEYDWYYYLRR